MSAFVLCSVFDDGPDLVTGVFNQNAAYTCNIVKATTPAVVQCVHGPTQAAGVFSFGQWTAGNAFINEGDMSVVTGRIAGVVGYVGGQSFPFTPGSGYSPNATITETAVCPTMASGGTLPKFDVTVAGGSIVDVYPSAAATTNGPQGIGIGSPCTVPLTGFSGGTGGSIATIPLGPTEGVGGIATYNTDSNAVGTFIYDNTGEPGNPLNLFFTNGMGGYFEPGNALRPMGMFQGLAVSG
jgi:hypothetical protein